MESRSDAGPSKPTMPAPASTASPYPRLFPYIQQGPSTASPISGSDDLLGIFNLSSAYDRYVRPYLKAPDVAPSALGGTATEGDGAGKAIGGDIKGKGKAMEADSAKPMINGSAAGKPGAAGISATVEAGQGPAGEGGGAKEGPKRAKMEKSYGHWVTDIGGRNSIKKDHYLRDLLMDPDWQPPPPGSIKPLEPSALGAAFTLLPGALAGFDASHWVAEEGGPKRKKKKRKHSEAMAGESPTVSIKDGKEKEDEHRKKKRPKP